MAWRISALCEGSASLADRAFILNFGASDTIKLLPVIAHTPARLVRCLDPDPS